MDALIGLDFIQASSFYHGHHSIMIQVVHEGVVPVDPLIDGRAGVGLVVREEDHTPNGNFIQHEFLKVV